MTPSCSSCYITRLAFLTWPAGNHPITHSPRLSLPQPQLEYRLTTYFPLPSPSPSPSPLSISLLPVSDHLCTGYLELSSSLFRTLPFILPELFPFDSYSSYDTYLNHPSPLLHSSLLPPLCFRLFFVILFQFALQSLVCPQSTLLPITVDHSQSQSITVNHSQTVGSPWCVGGHSASIHACVCTGRLKEGKTSNHREAVAAIDGGEQS